MKKLIEDYQKRVVDYDNQISQITKDIQLMRKGETPSQYFDGIEEAANERKTIDKLRQQLFQVTKDLESFQ